MICKLHLPTVYDPLTDAYCCVCGAVVVTAIESADSGRWRCLFKTRPQAEVFR